MGTIDIPWLNFSLGFILLAPPLAILAYFKTGLLKTGLISALRMTVQLLLLGVYLKYLFEWNLAWLNITWAILMSIVAVITIGRRSEISFRRYLLPVTTGIFMGCLLILFIFLTVILQPDNSWDARYLIPVAGMLLGNCLQSGIIGLRSFRESMLREREQYLYYLACGASRQEALFPVSGQAFRAAFTPMLAGMASIGLISLPGMMTGQILGGSSPLVAVKYQIMIMVAIFSASVLNVYFTLKIAGRTFFNEMDILKNDVK